MKKIISVSLVLAMMLALSVSAFAATPASQDMEVSYVVDSNYVIVIPDGGDQRAIDCVDTAICAAVIADIPFFKGFLVDKDDDILISSFDLFIDFLPYTRKGSIALKK